MIIKETSIFTNIITKELLITDDSYRELQNELVANPDKGAIIPGSGGLRKIRWKLSGKGKRGGIRVIYYWFKNSEELYMLFAYTKAKCEDLTGEQLKVLSKLVKEELSDG